MAQVSRLARYLVIATYAAIIIGVPFFVIELLKRGTERHIIAWAVAGVFVLLTVPISVHTIVQHLMHYHRPDIQRYIVRILWMVPLYAVESYLSLRYKQKAIYIEAIRDLYEAYVIYCFLYFLIAWFGAESHLAHKLRQKPPGRGRHFWPFNWFLKPWRLGSEFLFKCKQGTLQYVLVKTITSIATILLEKYHVYGEGKVFDLTRGYFYVAFISGASQTWAMYCLVIFYHVTVEELAPMRPLAKFLSVKAVVFFSWWQSIALAVMVQIGLINATMEYSDEDISKGLQNFLVCIEMFVAAIAHRWVFEYQDFVGEIDDTVLTRESAVASASKSASIASSIPANEKRAKSRLKFWKKNEYQRLESEDLEVDETKEDGNGTAAPGEIGCLQEDDEEARSGEGAENPNVGDQEQIKRTKKPFFRAFIESSFPGDVVSDIGRHVSRSHRDEMRREAGLQWGPASHFSGRNVRIEPRGVHDISAAAEVTRTAREHESKSHTSAVFSDYQQQPRETTNYNY